MGLERAGMRCKFQVEIDDYCTKVLEKHWPDVPKYRDIKEIDGRELEPVELIAGGFPCQDLSYAGKGEGLGGKRSGLWYDFARIIRVVGPRYVLVENVSGLLGRGMGVVLRDLARLGYDAEWQSLPAAAFGAPHLRWRVFIVAYASDHGCGGASVPDSKRQAVSEVGGGSERDVAYARRERDERRGEFGDVAGPQGEGESQATQRQRVQDAAVDSSEDVAHAEGLGLQRHRATRLVFAQPQSSEGLSGCNGAGTGKGVWEVEPSVGRLVDGLPHRVDQLRGLGNAVVPQVAQFVGERILEYHSNTTSPALTPRNIA